MRQPLSIMLPQVVGAGLLWCEGSGHAPVCGALRGVGAQPKRSLSTQTVSVESVSASVCPSAMCIRSLPPFVTWSTMHRPTLAPWFEASISRKACSRYSMTGGGSSSAAKLTSVFPMSYRFPPLVWLSYGVNFSPFIPAESSSQVFDAVLAHGFPPCGKG